MSEYICHEDGILYKAVYLNIPSEKIIRCRDCKHGIEVVWPVCYDIPADWLNCHGYLAPSWDYYNDEPSNTPVPPNGFCSFGERREQ